MECAIQDVLTKPSFSKAQGGRSVKVHICSVEQQFVHLVAQRADIRQMN